MPAESLNHYTIQARDVEKTKDFYEQIVGLKVGDRPPLNFPGYWLYCGGTPTVHLLGYQAHAKVIPDGPSYPAETGRLDGFLALSRAVWRTRGFGDFWSHMLVAEGAVDISAEPEVSLWDLAALQVIVEEAGGRFTSLAGDATPDGGSVVCTNGHLHDGVLAHLART